MLWITGAAAKAAKRAALRDTTNGTARPAQHLTPLDLARRWQLSSRTLERWRHGGHGPIYLKCGNSVLYRLEDVEAYEAAQQRGGSERAAATAPSRHIGLGKFASLFSGRLLRSRPSAASRRGHIG